MTTITIKNGKKLKKTNLLNVGELIHYLLENDGYGILHPLEENEITPERENQFNKALSTDKSKMLNKDSFQQFTLKNESLNLQGNTIFE